MDIKENVLYLNSVRQRISLFCRLKGCVAPRVSSF